MPSIARLHWELHSKSEGNNRDMEPIKVKFPVLHAREPDKLDPPSQERIGFGLSRVKRAEHAICVTHTISGSRSGS